MRSLLLDRLLSVARGSNTFSYLYDNAGNVTRRTYPGSVVTDYAYDALNRLKTVTNGGQTTSYAYDIASNLTQTTLPAGNGYLETRTYDRPGRLIDVESKKGATTLAKFALNLDPAGNPLSVVRTGSSLTQIQTYTYDASDRLLSVCFQAGTCPNASDPFIRWSYDKVGNRLTEQRPGASTTNYGYDFRDRLLSAGSTSYGYDQNGNELSAGTRTFTYDLANRLKTTTQASTTTTFAYDGDSVRLQASTGTQANKKTNFLWDVNDGLPQVALERDGNNSLLRRYTYGAERVSMTSGNNTSYYIRDGLGSTANLTSSSGATQWTWSYEPFGSMRTETKASGNQPDNFMKFTGEYLDPTGLYHLRARQYDTGAGRFLQVDPRDQATGTSAVATYVYAADQPTVLSDPSGASPGEALQPSTRHFYAVGDATSSESPAFRFPIPLIPDLVHGCGAKPGYPLGVIGGFNGGRAAHHAKHSPNDPWESTEAIDLNVPVGTFVCAVFKGVISPNLGFGSSSEGLRLHLVGATDIAFYTHLSRILVRRGQRVERGQLIALSGCGSEHVPHLHLALRYGNPDRYAPPYKKAVNYGGCL